MRLDEPLALRPCLRSAYTSAAGIGVIVASACCWSCPGGLVSTETSLPLSDSSSISCKTNAGLWLRDCRYTLGDGAAYLH